MRRYELMLVIRPDIGDDAVQAIIDRVTRALIAGGGQIAKVSPWGRRRLAYQIGQVREGSYFLIVFDAQAEGVAELERSLNITEEVMRHLVTRVERPANARRPAAADESEIGEDGEDSGPPPEDDDIPDTEFIDESESEAAPAAIDR
ncbi:MAG TPA: 30S ribosomal protein S6 [Candidatus Limnocylindrales bacterium]|jgi:small subunit ribosomal protein S6|nr:30S ribosomal protein S6 [Candidatus Limnocylindrales bacterium]